MAFTPKFVDLVRNVATVTGTGPVTLGAAVNGYSSLAGAVAAGEQFYYCVQGIDKPTEREIGRGTMQADGRVARQAIAGPLTNFTGGTKTIALVAAAEWFATLDQLASGAASAVATRTELAARPSAGNAAALLREPGREGLFVFDPSNLSAKISADAAQGIYVAPASDSTGASGAWVRRHDGSLNVRWFGARGDNIINDGAAFVAAIAYLKSTRLPVGYGYGQGSGELFVPAGQYFLGTTTLDISHTINIRGEAMGHTGAGSTVLRWSAGATGFRIQASNTEGATGANANPPTTPGGAGSIIEKLFLMGGYAGTEGEFHGIHLRGMVTVRDVYIRGFQGDGIHAAASVGTGAPLEGNVNLVRIERVTIDNCRNGIYFDGADGNAGHILAANCTANRQWGIWDSSFLGNTYIGCHTASNGRVTGTLPTTAIHNGNRYYVLAGQSAGATSNAPSGTTADNVWWGHISAGGIIGSGMANWDGVQQFREGGAYKTDSPNARNLFEGCYSEGDQNPAQLVTPTVVISGLQAADIKGTASWFRSDFNGPNIVCPSAAAYVNFTLGNTTAARVSAIGIEPAADNSFDLGTSSLKWKNIHTVGMTVTGGLSIQGATQAMGPTGGAPADFNLYFENTNFNHFLTFRSWSAGVPQTDATIRARRGNGLELNGTVNVKLQRNGSDLLIADDDSVRIVKAGTVLGYGVGAGGSVTQATSKSTGVTLHKASGQLIMNNAALAAGTSVSFTLTNSVIAATDALIVNIADGAAADSYDVAVSAVGAGSARIQLRNIAAGSLAEALVLNFAVIKAVAT